MGAIVEPQPVLLIIAAFSRHEAAMQWGRDRAEAEWGPIALTSPAFDFDQTTYYEKSMGPALKKQVLGVCRTNFAWEGRAKSSCSLIAGRKNMPRSVIIMKSDR